MGKKLMHKDKGAAQGHDDDPSKTPEPYNCTGNFEADFAELARRGGMQELPVIMLRPKRPSTPPPHDPKKDDKNMVAAAQADDGNQGGVKETEEAPPTTYTVKEKFQYFKPSIQVEMENDNNPKTVTEIHIRGWKVDMKMLEIFQQCWPAMEKLHTVHLWNTGLTDSTLERLAKFLPHCTNLKTLFLEGNNTLGEQYNLLLEEESLIAHLSLRNNRMTDKGATLIGSVLGNPKATNKNLVTLNLSYNNFTSVGALNLAMGLRMNRTLLSMSLASNKIGDDGCKALAEVLSRFKLTHEEVVERRVMLRDKDSPDRLGKSPPPSRRGDKTDRPGSTRSSTMAHTDKDRKSGSKSTKKKGPETKKDDTANKTVNKKEDVKLKKEPPKHSSKASLTANDTTKTKGKKGSSTKDKKGLLQNDTEAPEVFEHIHPFLEQAETIDGALWIPGNRALINLNLSRNEISEVGLKHLLLSLKYQQTLSVYGPRHTMGLMRLILTRNNISADNDTYIKLHDIMVTRDPFYKPTAKTPDDDSHSQTSSAKA